MLQFSKSMIHGVVLQQIFLQHFICPLTELSTSYGFYPVTYRNNDIYGQENEVYNGWMVE